MRVYEALAVALRKLGTDTVFGLLGGGNYPLATAIAAEGIAFHALRHESAVVSAADGWSRATRRLGVATCTQGPGLTNTLTPLTEAVKARTPLLVLAGRTARTAQYQNQDVDQDQIVRSVGAGVHPLRSAELAVADLAQAAWRAQRERRPVVLSLPTDLQAMDISPRGESHDPEVELPVQAVTSLVAARPSAAAVTEVADRLVAAQRPVILAGRGAWYADAGTALAAVAQRCGALLTTSAVAHGLFAGNPHALGISGGFASPLAERLIAQADLVLAVGASLNTWTTKAGALLAGAQVVQVDADESAVGRLAPADLGLVGDAGATAAALLAELDRRGVQREGYRTVEITAAIAGYRWEDDIDDRSQPGAVDPRSLMAAFERILPAERTVAIDSGHFMGWPAQYLSVTDPGGFVFTQAFQSVGLGLGSAIGAAVARPDRLCVLVIGDGGLLMSLGELDTVVRGRLPMLIIVCNDAAYGAEVHHFGPMGLTTELAEFDNREFAAVAEAMGLRAETVRAVDDVDRLKDWLEHRDGPLLVDCKVNRSVRAHWLEEAFRAGA